MEISGLRKLRNLSNPIYLYSVASQSSCSFRSASSDSKTLAVPIDPCSEISRHYSRFSAKTVSNSADSPIYFAASSSVSGRLILNLGLLRISCRSFRRFSASSFSESSPSTPAEMRISKQKSHRRGDFDAIKPIATPEQVSDVIDIIQRNEEDLESKLNSLNVSLSHVLVAQIFRVLNTQKVSAIRFFNWIRIQPHKFPRNSDIYSLLIDNFGRLDDYEGMLLVLTDFRRKGIGLNHKAFGFLPDLLSNKASVKISVNRVVELFNKVGGSFGISGIIALIQMFCSRGAFGMAKFVIDETERRVTFYNIIVREKCRRCDFEGATDTLNEMKLVRCGPDVGIYNYLLSSLCKNNRFDEAYKVFEEMLEGDCPPDPLTYEVIIYHLCGTSKIDSAFTFLEMMESRGLEPRLSTHAAFIKGYFDSHRYDEAYQYVIDSSSKHLKAQNAVYSLLASLHEERGNFVFAHTILTEMMGAGLRPNLPVYRRVLKKLQNQGRGDLAYDLKGKFSDVSRIETG